MRYLIISIMLLSGCATSKLPNYECKQDFNQKCLKNKFSVSVNINNFNDAINSCSVQICSPIKEDK